MKTGLMTHKLTLNTPSHMQSIAHISLAGQWSCRLCFGTSSTGSERRGLRSEALCAVEVFEKLRAAIDLEDCRKLLRRIEEERIIRSPLVSCNSIVSSCNRCYSMRVLNLRFKLRGPGNSISGWSVHLQVSNTSSFRTTSPCVLQNRHAPFVHLHLCMLFPISFAYTCVSPGLLGQSNGFWFGDVTIALTIPCNRAPNV